MDKKSKFLIFGFLFLVLGVLSYMYFRIFFLHDYTVQSEIDCDPYVEECFIYECDKLANECTGDPDQDIFYYKKIKRYAGTVPICSESDQNCSELLATCGESEHRCEYVYCDTDGGDDCTNPIEFIEEHPIELDGIIDGEDSAQIIESVPGLEEIKEESAALEIGN